jgi:hypothetical protein
MRLITQGRIAMYEDDGFDGDWFDGVLFYLPLVTAITMLWWSCM